MTARGKILDVSDTALWVATYRGNEGRRANAAFDDPLSGMLAGARGRDIAASMPRAAIVAWAMTVRTSAIDVLIDEALKTGIDSVLNLGAGLDTRPYRLALPAALRWVEVDLPQLVAAKEAALRGHAPACRIERVGLDLLDRAGRQELFARIASQSAGTLVITEGVIPYFSNADAASLAGDVLAVPSFRRWILDFDNSGERPMPRAWAKRLAAAPFLFRVADWFEFFAGQGWHPRRIITSADQAAAIGRPYPFAFPLGFIMHALPASVRHKILSLSGAAVMERQPPRPGRS